MNPIRWFKRLEFETKIYVFFICFAPGLVGLVLFVDSIEMPCVEGDFIKATNLKSFNAIANDPRNEITSYQSVSGFSKGVIIEYTRSC